MIQYGFELEGFATVNNEVVLPPKHWPRDGHPGIVELRSTGGKTLENAYFEVCKEYMNLECKEDTVFDYTRNEHKFTGKELAELRRTSQFHKEVLDIRNLYGKEPRTLHGKSITAFQINISNLIANKYEIESYSKDGVKTVRSVPAQYGMLDIGTIIRRLDEEFKEEIGASNRQKGFYCLKDNDTRLEYRSLPSSIFKTSLSEIKTLLSRIKTVIEGK